MEGWKNRGLEGLRDGGMEGGKGLISPAPAWPDRPGQAGSAAVFTLTPGRYGLIPEMMLSLMNSKIALPPRR